MRCRKARSLLGSYLDGELSVKSLESLTGHLKKCPGCRTELDALQKVHILSRKLTQPEPDEDYWRNFLPRLRAKIELAEGHPVGQKPSPTWGRWFSPPLPWVRVAGAVGTAVLVLLLGRAVYRRETEMERIRSLPKKLLLEQAQQAEQETGEKRDELDERIGTSPDQTMEMISPPAKDISATSGPESFVGKGLSGPPEELSEVAIAPQPGEETAIAPSPSAPTAPLSSEQTAPTRTEEITGADLFASTSAGQRRASDKSSLTAVTLGEPQHWRAQVHRWQRLIASHPDDQEISEAYLRLAESWFSLALLTAQRDDLLAAADAQRAALDFAAEDSSRELLRGRIQILEDQLRKK